MNFDTPLYPSAKYQTSKDLGDLRGVAVYAVAMLSRSLGTIEGAELNAKHAKRVVWAEMDASNSAQSGAQALQNVATIYANRAGGPTGISGLVEDSARRIWSLCQAQGKAADPAHIFDDLSEELAQSVGLVLAALENTTTARR